MMARVFAVLAVSATLGWGLPVAAAADTVSGEILDLACYLPHPQMKGQGHKKCAETCVKKGLPMGLLTDDGQVYVILEDHDNPKPYAALKDKAAQKVTIEGDKVSQGGTQGIVVQAVK
jgi:hypothetical protein